MICGVCGGGVRGYSGTLSGRPIKDWKHTSVPPDTKPHRPVLGTPVDEETLARQRAMKEETRAPKPPPEPVAPPAVPARLAKASEVPASAVRTVDLAELHGWSMEPPTYVQTAAGIEWCVVRGRRARIGVIGCWERRLTNKDPKWSYESGYEVVRGRARQVGSEQLKQAITRRDERCPDCGAASIAHDEGKCPS